MLTYDHPVGFRSVWILFYMHGSCFPRTFRVVCFPTMFSLIIEYLAKDEKWYQWIPWIVHPFAPQVFAIVLGFAIVFRTNMALGRYWEGVTNMEQMTCKWSDSYMQLCNYMNCTLMGAKGKDKEVEKRVDLLRRTLAHFFTMLTALAVCQLRSEDPGATIPQIISRPIKSVHEEPHIQRKASIMPMMLGGRASTMAGSSASVDKNTFRKSWTPMSTLPEKLEEEESTSSFVLFSTKTYDVINVATLPFRCLSLLRPRGGWKFWKCRWRAQTAPDGEREASEHIDKKLEILGSLLQEEAAVLDQAVDKVAVVIGWITMLVTEFSIRGWIACPAPVLCRVYQETSHGMSAYHQACKVTLIPFPFPFTQILQFQLVVFLVICPIMVAQHSHGYITVALLTFCVTMGYWGLNEICAELENPYGEDINDLPLEGMHADFVSTIESILSRSADPDDPFATMVEDLFYINDAPSDRDSSTMGAGEQAPSVD
eukprot:GEMP01019897.1.p1 GENE.GEMP01019897.1~~GEMP01019897.1.p1  ORF type:complete len:484 (+),score=77.33 GEMP01019897.1:375-1826(+)